MMPMRRWTVQYRYRTEWGQDLLVVSSFGVSAKTSPDALSRAHEIFSRERPLALYDYSVSVKEDKA